MLDINSPAAMEKSEMVVHVLYLHRNQHLIEQTARLLNSEWTRSLTARVRSLESGIKSENGFPISLILTTQTNLLEEVLGHGKALLLFNTMEACYVESVVIAKAERGKGYGRLIMAKIEEYVRLRGIKWIYLKTKDQYEFYKKLGYSICKPFTFSGSSSATIQARYKDINSAATGEDSDETNQEIDRNDDVSSPKKNDNFHVEASTCAGDQERIFAVDPKFTIATNLPPPPPPLRISSQLPTFSTSNCSINTVNVYMKKKII